MIRQAFDEIKNTIRYIICEILFNLKLSKVAYKIDPTMSELIEMSNKIRISVRQFHNKVKKKYNARGM